MGSGSVTTLFVHSSDELYGADRMLLAQLDALGDGARGCAVMLPNDIAHVEHPLCELIEARGIRVWHEDIPILRRAYFTPTGLVRLARRCWSFRRRVREVGPATVYCTTSAAALAAPLARLAGTRRVLMHVQEIWSRTDRWILSGPARFCARFLAISTAVAQELPSFMRARTRVVPNGVPEPDDVVAMDGRLGPLRFVVASRWNGWKGHATLLAAWDRLSEGELVVLGGPPPSGAVTDVAALVRQLRRPDSVRIVGEVDDPSPYLSDADVVIMPSDRPEPFGLVAIEAFARARPVIASAGGGLLDIVSEGVDGWLFPLGDVDALAAVLRGLDRGVATAAGAAARQTYLDRFTASGYGERWLAALRD